MQFFSHERFVGPTLSAGKWSTHVKKLGYYAQRVLLKGSHMCKMHWEWVVVWAHKYPGGHAFLFAKS